MKRSSVTCVSSVTHEYEGLRNYVNSMYATPTKKKKCVWTFLQGVWKELSFLHRIKLCAFLRKTFFALQMKFWCTCECVLVCLCCSSPANSNSSVASEQEERGSLKTKYRAYITNSSVHPRTPCATNTLLLHPHLLLPPTPTGRAHPSSSSPPIATAHLISPPLFLDQQIASTPTSHHHHHPPPHPLSAPLVPATSSFLSSHSSFLLPHHSKPYFKLYKQHEYEPGILTRVKTGNFWFYWEQKMSHCSQMSFLVSGKSLQLFQRWGFIQGFGLHKPL